VRFEILRPGELGESELTRWRALQDATPVLANPFLSPEFTLAVGLFRTDARVAVLSDGDGIAGFLPFERHTLGVGRPIGAGLTDCQGLIGPSGLDFDVRALLRACHLSVWEFDHLLAEQAAFAPYHAETRSEPVMDLSEGFEAYADGAKERAPRRSRRSATRTANSAARPAR
jgi:CelD/BcsL family acetyltransferase involved in cellulose biosynthesis